MNFYFLQEPPATDERGRSLDWSAGGIPGMPGLTCSVCGVTWARDSARLHVKPPRNTVLRHGCGRWPLPTAEFEDLANQVRRELNLPSDLPLLPGANVGPLRLKAVRADIPNFEWPGLNSIIATEQTVKALENAGLTGWRCEPVEMTWWRGWPLHRFKPVLFEVVITGKAGDAFQPSGANVPAPPCARCGRTSTDWRDNNATVSVDVSQWDGLDFSNFNDTGYIAITERAKMVIEDARLSNVQFSPLALWQ